LGVPFFAKGDRNFCPFPPPPSASPQSSALPRLRHFPIIFPRLSSILCMIDFSAPFRSIRRFVVDRSCDTRPVLGPKGAIAVAGSCLRSLWGYPSCRNSGWSNPPAHPLYPPRSHRLATDLFFWVTRASPPVRLLLYRDTDSDPVVHLWIRRTLASFAYLSWRDLRPALCVNLPFELISQVRGFNPSPLVFPLAPDPFSLTPSPE